MRHGLSKVCETCGQKERIAGLRKLRAQKAIRDTQSKLKDKK